MRPLTLPRAVVRVIFTILTQTVTNLLQTSCSHFFLDTQIINTDATVRPLACQCAFLDSGEGITSLNCPFLTKEDTTYGKFKPHLLNYQFTSSYRKWVN